MLADLDGLDIVVPSDDCLGRWRSDRLSAGRFTVAHDTVGLLPMSLGGGRVNERHLIGRIAASGSAPVCGGREQA